MHYQAHKFNLNCTYRYAPSDNINTLIVLAKHALKRASSKSNDDAVRETIRKKKRKRKIAQTCTHTQEINNTHSPMQKNSFVVVLSCDGANKYTAY